MKLVRANASHCQLLYTMQVEAFSELLAKYKDYQTSPANEPIERIQAKLTDLNSYFYLIYIDNSIVGAIRVVDKHDGSFKRISPIFISKEYRNKGYAKQAILLAESIHGANNWQLDTIMQEQSTCRLYEKLGYKPTGKVKNINEGMDIVFYKKD